MKIPFELLNGIILIDFTIFGGSSSSYPFEKDAFFDLYRFKINSFFIEIINFYPGHHRRILSPLQFEKSGLRRKK